MIIAASTLFHGAGIVLALAAGILWFGVPTARLLKRILRGQREGSLSRNPPCSTIGIATILALLLLTTIPWPGTPRAPAIVEFSPLTVIRAASPGFVADIRVHGGQFVEKGQILVVLQNEELELELADLELGLQQAEIKSRIYEHEREMAAWQAEAKNRESLQKKRQEKQIQVDTLTVRAPTTGTVIGRNLETLLGVYLEPGDEILSIGSQQHKELQVAVSQEDLIPFKTALGERLHVRLPGGQAFPSRLSRITPRATLECPHPALSAVNGGPLPVKAKSPNTDEPQNSDQNHQLLEPLFTGTIELTNEQSRQLNAGQVGAVALRSHRDTIGGHLYRVLTRWIRRKFRQSAQQRA
jgi:putative peptide zinc metalloprotease protein